MRKYTGYTYVKKLERCLRKLPYEERLDAVRYYSEYLTEAGPEREQEIIARLGPPQRVAAEIRADAALRELNIKAEIAAQMNERKKAERENRYTETDRPPEYARDGQATDADRETSKPRREEGANPRMGESLSAAGLGALGMLSLPVAKPLAVFACVLGIMGLAFSVIAVISLYIVAGALAISGAFCVIVSIMVVTQDVSVTIFLAGAGIAFLGAGLLIGTLNSLLGRAIFKGIANLSGHIRHKRVKVRKEIFNTVA
jgi:uncharacterized membrane protein